MFLLLKHGVTVNNVYDGNSAFYGPAFRTVASTVRHLLDPGAGVNRSGFLNPRGTPLKKAVEAGSEEIVRILLEHRADPRLKAHSNFSPLEIAERRGLEKIARLLREHASHGSQKSS